MYLYKLKVKSKDPWTLLDIMFEGIDFNKRRMKAILVYTLTSEFFIRIGYVVVLMTMSKLVSFQINIFMLSFVLMTALLVHARPYTDKNQTILQLFNNMCLYLVCILQITILLESKDE